MAGWTSDLSEAELEVLRFSSRGLDTSMIAEARHVSVHTVWTQLKKARFKLRAKNTTHACCEALRRGLID